ncbi:hypothetical protein Back2_17680 [Nocardioides baekrokdamisoli]|uniref:Uncharacterized protein n=1 Tax=Nocardioides baekrokdamisoli TaxID=1804624 RepID=A0A3G9IUZ3_9ACTN|nr:hypothetical protein [Nocardioides baekrokdamisoli]BBH17481.1 hypothetical protein Back2_17680 [Nocardioides baekrokdamisoli]
MSGNAKHQTAIATAEDRTIGLRAEISEWIRLILEATSHLEALVDTKQAIAIGHQNADTAAARAKQEATDRKAARTPVSQLADARPGLDWLRAVPGRAGANTKTPGTMPALSALAEISFTLQHNVRRIGRKHLLAVLEAEQTAIEDHEYCIWPPRRLALTVDHDAGSYQVTQVLAANDVVCAWPRRYFVHFKQGDENGIRHLAQHLTALAAVLNNRRELHAIVRDLEHLHDMATTVIDGEPAKQPAPRPTCPWCGRDSLVLVNRDPKKPWQTYKVIRCEGTHPCECPGDRDWCSCHRNATANRHEWVNAGRHGSAGASFSLLNELQNDYEEISRMETAALDAVDRIKQLHTPIDIYPWSSYCQSPQEHGNAWIEAEDGPDVCTACEPRATICAHCRNHYAENDLDWGTYPCPTIRTLEPPTEGEDR